MLILWVFKVSIKDLGVVLLPNVKCSIFAEYRMQAAAFIATGGAYFVNTPHITLIHIANLNEESQGEIRGKFLEFSQDKAGDYNLPIKGIKATGGDSETGFKWLDLQFHTLPPLADLRAMAVATFCPLHNGTLTRMFDDPNNFAEGSQSLEDIAKCGVAFSSYTPHITAWYVDLPNVSKSKLLEGVANDPLVASGIEDLSCYATAIALVELGRNGNAIEVIEQVSILSVDYDL